MGKVKNLLKDESYDTPMACSEATLLSHEYECL
jgi:hypothetical protein